MTITLQSVSLDQKDILRELLRVYEQELTGDPNPSEYKYLDSYWQKPNRKAFFIMVDNAVGGFVLVNQHLLIQPNGNNLSEFYIIPKYRGLKIGRQAAIQVFELFKGNWELRELQSNTKAHRFWLNVINDYTQGNYKETVLNSADWQGPVQTFNNLTT